MNTGALQFIGGIIVVGVLTWVANISDTTGDVAVALVLLLWLVWALKNGSQIGSLAGKVGL